LQRVYLENLWLWSWKASLVLGFCQQVYNLEQVLLNLICGTSIDCFEGLFYFGLCPFVLAGVLSFMLDTDAAGSSRNFSESSLELVGSSRN